MDNTQSTGSRKHLHTEMMHSCEAAFKDAKANDSIKVILFTRAGGAFPLGRDINATAPGGAIA